MPASSGPNSTRASGASALNLNELKVPRDPDKIFEKEAQERLDSRAIDIKTRVDTALRNVPELQRVVAELQVHLKNESLNLQNRRSDVESRIAIEAKAFIAEEPPLFADYVTAVAGTTLNPVTVQTTLDRKLQNDLYRIVSERINHAVEKGSAEYLQTIRNILKKSDLNVADINQLIIAAGSQLSSQEQARLEATGLIKMDGSTPPRSTEYFRNLRNVSLLTWGGALGVSAATIGGATIGLLGAGPAALIAAGACATNWIAHTLLRRSFDRAFKATWDEAKTELSSSVPQRAIAWLGMMTKLIQECSPIVFAKNSTEWWMGSKEHALSVDAVIEHLKTTAAAATEQIEQKREAYQSITDYAQKIGLAEPGLKALRERWNSHWTISERMVGVSTAISGGAAFLLF